MQTGVYRTGVAVKGTFEGKAEVLQELIEALEVLIKNNIDLIIVEVSTSKFKGICYFYSLVLPQH